MPAMPRAPTSRSSPRSTDTCRLDITQHVLCVRSTARFVGKGIESRNGGWQREKAHVSRMRARVVLVQCEVPLEISGSTCTSRQSVKHRIHSVRPHMGVNRHLRIAALESKQSA
eukprot:2907184-Rhodomonas_salina.1